MNNWPETFDQAVQPLAPDGLNEAGLEAVRLLADQGYEIYIGLTAEYAEAIAAMALEPAIRENCPKDCAVRFADRPATERWLGKKRAAFLLLKHEADGSLRLAGYGWAGPGSNPHVPGGQSTFAVRISEADHGKGLAAPFSRLIVEGAAVLYGARDIWLETWGSNGAAVHIYHKIGCVTVSERPDKRPTTVGSPVSDTRVYMSIPNDLLPTASA